MMGATYLWPKRPLYPVYPPGSLGSRSGSPVLEGEQVGLFCAQWMPIPTKSANAWPGFAVTSCACGEFGPNTVGISIAVFSSMEFAVATVPTLQPAREYGTQGAGAVWPEAANRLYLVSVGVVVF